MELSVDIATNSDGSLDWLDIALFDKDLLDLLTEDSELPLRKDGSAFESFEPVVDVALAHFNVFVK